MKKYQNTLRDKNGRLKPVPLKHKLWNRIRINKRTECWEFQGSLDSNGYGHFNHKGKRRRTHKYVFELKYGPVKKGLEIDHLCRNPCCCNPKHLEPVTHRENILRGNTFAARQAAQIHCKRGHLLQGHNLMINKYGHRSCRTCHNQWRNKKNREKTANPTNPCACGCGKFTSRKWCRGHNVHITHNPKSKMH